MIEIKLAANTYVFLWKSSDPDWWNVYVIRTGQTGFVPRNFVAVEKSIESEE